MGLAEILIVFAISMTVGAAGTALIFKNKKKI